jgi:hypothetical protein
MREAVTDAFACSALQANNAKLTSMNVLITLVLIMVYAMILSMVFVVHVQLDLEEPVVN